MPCFLVFWKWKNSYLKCYLHHNISIFIFPMFCFSFSWHILKNCSLVDDYFFANIYKVISKNNITHSGFSDYYWLIRSRRNSMWLISFTNKYLVCWDSIHVIKSYILSVSFAFSLSSTFCNQQPQYSSHQWYLYIRL